MNIVIAGAGLIGLYVARFLSKEKHNVILIDPDSKRLEEASLALDVGIRIGTCTDWKLLELLLEQNPDIYIALTDNDQANFVSCSIAKNLGYPLTIARVRDDSYLDSTRLDFGRLFDIDHFIGPELLVAHELYKLMVSPGSLSVESFAHGAVQLRTISIPASWKKEKTPLYQLDLPPEMMVGLIHRLIGDERKVIFPHGKDTILPGDEVTLLGETEAIVEAHSYFGIEQKSIESVVIIGGSRVAVNLAKILQDRGIAVRIIEQDYNKCTYISELLHDVTVLHHDGTDIDFLFAEKIGLSDLLVVCTRNDEFNMMAALLGKEAGSREVIIQLSNRSYAPILKKLGINYTSSPGKIAADRIVALATSGTVTSMVSLYENEAEIMEIYVPMDSKVTGVPLSELGGFFPKDFLIGLIQNCGKIMIANGEKMISPGDTVIVISHPKHIHELERIF